MKGNKTISGSTECQQYFTIRDSRMYTHVYTCYPQPFFFQLLAQLIGDQFCSSLPDSNQISGKDRLLKGRQRKKLRIKNAVKGNEL